MAGATSQSGRSSRPSAVSTNAARSSSRCISLTAWAWLPCIRSPTAFTRQPLQRACIRSRSSSAASSSPRPKASRALSTMSCFWSLSTSGSSSFAVTSTRKKALSWGLVSSRSFSSRRSQASTSSRSFCTSSGVTAGLFRRRRALLTSMPLFAPCTISLVTSLSMPKNMGTQLVSVEMSSSLSSPCCPIFCLMNMLHQRETMRTRTFCIPSSSRPKTPPTCGFARCHLSRETLSWHVMAFQAKMP
mmetsp:Transcript_38691/g.115592  ORF Transcript_38691/g.115592 Transcript_38691/m.115592 type:complete len:245 (-) Transcript_38691:2148-2882(-)